MWSSGVLKFISGALICLVKAESARGGAHAVLAAQKFFMIPT